METTTKKNLFIDMDGTIAKFYEHAQCLEMMWKPGFFLNLNAYEEVIDGLLSLKAKMNNGVNLYTLSAINESVFDRTKDEKLQWLQSRFCGILPTDNIIFTLVGENKARAVETILGRELSADDFLLDDYNANLTAWNNAGGSSIKLVNDINDKGTYGPLWTGARVRYDWSSERICDELLNVIFIKEN